MSVLQPDSDPCESLCTRPLPLKRRSKYPPAEPVLYGYWPLKGDFSQPSEAKARTNAKASYCCLHCRSTGNSRENILPEFSKFYCHPGRARGSPLVLAAWTRLWGREIGGRAEKAQNGNAQCLDYITHSCFCLDGGAQPKSFPTALNPHMAG
jgi:hypothetical protein